MTSLDRRHFHRTLGALAAASCLGLPLGARAQGAAPVEGRDFKKMASPLAGTIPAGKAEVVEIFGYWCPHCASFEPAMEAWAAKLPANVTLRRIPMARMAREEPLARLYHALDLSGTLPALHGKVFKAIHEQRLPLFTDDDIIAWLKNQGAEGAKAAALQKSFAVATRTRQSAQTIAAAQVDSVPTLIVQNRWQVVGPSLPVTDALIQRALQGG